MGVKPENRAIKFKQSALGILYYKFFFVAAASKETIWISTNGSFFLSLSTKNDHFYFSKLKIALFFELFPV